MPADESAYGPTRRAGIGRPADKPRRTHGVPAPVQGAAKGQVMARKRREPATVNRGLILIPRRQATAEERAAGIPPSLVGARHVETANDALVEPPIMEGILTTIEQENLSGNATVEALFDIVGEYCIERCAEQNAVTIDDVNRYCKKFLGVAEELLEIISDNSTAAIHARKLISETVLFDVSAINWDDFYPMVSLAVAKSSARVRAGEVDLAAVSSPSSSAWVTLISRCADLFVTAGRRPTAAKSSNANNPRPSAFVAFVHTLMGTAVPPSYREHMQSHAAMADAVSEILRAWRIQNPKE